MCQCLASTELGVSWKANFVSTGGSTWLALIHVEWWKAQGSRSFCFFLVVVVVVVVGCWLAG